MDKTAHDRFVDLGTRILSVPKSEVDKRETKWKRRKRLKPNRKKR